MERLMTDKVPGNLLMNFPGHGGYKEVKEPTAATTMEPRFYEPGPLFESEFEQLLINTSHEIEKRTRFLSEVNQSLSEFLTGMESLINTDSNSNSPL